MSDKKGKDVERKISTKEYLRRLNAGEFGQGPVPDRKGKKSKFIQLMEEARGTSAEDEEARVRNRASKKAGDRLEDWLLEEAESLLFDQGIELIYIPPRLKFWRPVKEVVGVIMRFYPRMRNVFIAHPDKPTWVDFIAFWEGGSAHFDAKSTRSRGNAWMFSKQIEEHQMDILMRQHAKKKAAFIFLRHHLERGYDDYVIPVTGEGLEKVKTKTQVQWKALRQWRVPKGHTWWDAAKRWPAYVDRGWSYREQT